MYKEYLYEYKAPNYKLISIIKPSFTK